MTAVYVHRPIAPAPEDVLGDDLLAAAGQLEDGLHAVLQVNGVSDEDAGAALGNLRSQAIRLVAISWRRSGRFVPGTVARPVGAASTSMRVTAATADAAGRITPANVDAVVGQIRSKHPDAAALCGLVCWTWQDAAGELVREVVVPGVDFVISEDGGPFRAVTPLQEG
jgi:hypothetical protein